MTRGSWIALAAVAAALAWAMLSRGSRPPEVAASRSATRSSNSVRAALSGRGPVTKAAITTQVLITLLDRVSGSKIDVPAKIGLRQFESEVVVHSGEGAVQVPSLPFMVSVDAPGFYRSGALVSSLDHSILLDPCRELAITVFNEQGLPVAGATVLIREGVTAAATGELVSGRESEFRTDNLGLARTVVGRYSQATLTVSADGYCAKKLVIRPEVDEQRVVLRLGSPVLLKLPEGSSPERLRVVIDDAAGVRRRRFLHAALPRNAMNPVNLGTVPIGEFTLKAVFRGVAVLDVRSRAVAGQECLFVIDALPWKDRGEAPARIRRDFLVTVADGVVSAQIISDSPSLGRYVANVRPGLKSSVALATDVSSVLVRARGHESATVEISDTELTHVSLKAHTMVACKLVFPVGSPSRARVRVLGQVERGTDHPWQILSVAPETGRAEPRLNLRIGQHVLEYELGGVSHVETIQAREGKPCVLRGRGTLVLVRSTARSTGAIFVSWAPIGQSVSSDPRSQGLTPRRAVGGELRSRSPVAWPGTADSFSLDLPCGTYEVSVARFDSVGVKRITVLPLAPTKLSLSSFDFKARPRLLIHGAPPGYSIRLAPSNSRSGRTEYREVGSDGEVEISDLPPGTYKYRTAWGRSGSVTLSPGHVSEIGGEAGRRIRISHGNSQLNGVYLLRPSGVSFITPVAVGPRASEILVPLDTNDDRMLVVMRRGSMLYHWWGSTQGDATAPVPRRRPLPGAPEGGPVMHTRVSLAGLDGVQLGSWLGTSLPVTSQMGRIKHILVAGKAAEFRVQLDDDLGVRTFEFDTRTDRLHEAR